MGLYLHNGWATLFITLLTKHVITLKFVLNGKGDFVANFTHFPCTCIQPVGWFASFARREIFRCRMLCNSCQFTWITSTTYMSDPIYFFYFFAISFQQCILCRQTNLVRKIALNLILRQHVCVCWTHTVVSNGLKAGLEGMKREHYQVILLIFIEDNSFLYKKKAWPYLFSSLAQKGGHLQS